MKAIKGNDAYILRGDGEERGGEETQCMACKRRGRRVIYWSHQECHECANRREDARIIREQRKAVREMAWRESELVNGARSY